MIARIKTKNGCYDSAVFALFQKGRNWRAVVLNRNYNALETVNICPNKRKFFLYDTVKGEGWITERHAEGYDWVLKNTARSLFKTVFRPPILTKCKSLQETVKKREWFSIETEDDLSGLMACAFHFHDSYVKNIDHQGETRYIRFDTTWHCEIILELVGNIQTNLFQNFGRSPDENGEYITISDSSMFIEHGRTYWVDEASVQSSSELEKTDFHFFCADSVRWKLIIP